MYGIPLDLNLDAIIGYDLNLLGLGRYDMQLNFSGSGMVICIQGNITLKEKDEIIAKWNEHDNWSALSFQKLLNATVKKYFVANPHLLEIEFENNLVLQIHDDNDMYEAMQIYFDDKTKSPIIV